MNGIDLGQFQFDYDQTWAALFLHPDGTVFARYGSRDAEGPMSRNSREGLRNTMERVLEAWEGYPGNRAGFAAKRGEAPAYRYPRDIPSPTIRRVLTRPEGERSSCIHCHNIYDGLHEALVEAGRYDPDRVWKYPLPENVGLTLDPDTGTRVESVQADTPAARAGIRAGDEIRLLDGQAILSVADVQFVLHGLPDRAVLDAVVTRGSEQVEVRLAMEPGWRRTDISWRGSMYPMPPKPGLWVEELDEAGRERRGLSGEGMALEIRGVFGEAVRRSGLREGDVIVGSGDRRQATSAPAFHADLRLRYFRPGATLRLRILRNGEEREMPVRF